jgi:outer membrane protein assembly factor BamB
MSGASFKGNLEVLNLSDIFQSLAMNRHSGTLIISDGKREKKIFFAEGEIQLLSSSRRMKLGELLIATGKITEEDLDLALKLQKQNRKKLGEILVEEGFCAEEDVARIVKFQIEEEIYDLFLWKKADFEFIADHLPEDMKRDSSNLMRLNLNTNSLIMEALRRLDEWEVVKQAVPSTKEVFMIVDERKLDAIDLPERLKNEIHLIDGKTNVEGLAEKTMISEFELCKLLAELVHQGAIMALPTERLVQKAEEAYAVNDFAAAANLYGRLAEIAPGEPKVLVPLAESLRRSGDDRQALLVFEDLSNKLDPSRDMERLKRCWESILALDPERTDVARKLEQMEAQAQARKNRGRIVPIPVLVIAAIAIVGGVFHNKLRLIINELTKDPHSAQKEEDNRLADQLRQQYLEALNFNKDYKKAFAIATDIIKKFPNTPARDQVSLPLRVRTEPTGFAVKVNGDAKGETSTGQPAVDCSYSTKASKVLIQIFKINPNNARRVGDTPLREITLDDPLKWPDGDEVKFVVEDSPDKKFFAEYPIETEFGYWPSGKAYVAIARNGSVFLLDDKTFERQEGWKDVTVGQFGDVFSAPMISGSKAYVGLSQGGVAVIDLDAKTVSIPFPIDVGSVTTKPLLFGKQGRLVVATTTGNIYGFPIQGNGKPWVVSTDGAINFAGVVADDDGETIAFASTDERVRAIKVATGEPAWNGKKTVIGVPHANLARAKSCVLVATEDGALHAIDAKTGVERGEPYRDPLGKPFRFAIDGSGDRIFIAAEDGRICAIDGLDFTKQLWPTPPKRQTASAPRIYYLPKTGSDSAPIADRVLVSFDDSRLAQFDPTTGLLAWEGNVESGAVTTPATIQTDCFLVATSVNYITIFQRQ